MKEDRFGTKESYITRLTLNEPLINYDNAVVFVITDKHGVTFETKIEPDNDYKELFKRNDILLSLNKPYRKVASRTIIIARIHLRVMSKGKKLEYISESIEGAQKNYNILEKELVKLNISIKDEKTKKCSKESCLLKHKGTTQQDIY